MSSPTPPKPPQPTPLIHRHNQPQPMAQPTTEPTIVTQQPKQKKKKKKKKKPIIVTQRDKTTAKTPLRPIEQPNNPPSLRNTTKAKPTKTKWAPLRWERTSTTEKKQPRPSSHQDPPNQTYHRVSWPHPPNQTHELPNHNCRTPRTNKGTRERSEAQVRERKKEINLKT